MINSICLSSDMNTLFLIDDGRAIAFDLLKDNGILVGLIRDQLTVVTAAKAMPDTIPGKIVNRVEFLIKGNQWTATYHPDLTTMFIIGILDIDSAITAGEEPVSRSKSVDLSKGAINIRRIDTKIELTYLTDAPTDALVN